LPRSYRMRTLRRRCPRSGNHSDPSANAPASAQSVRLNGRDDRRFSVTYEDGSVGLTDGPLVPIEGRSAAPTRAASAPRLSSADGGAPRARCTPVAGQICAQNQQTAERIQHPDRRISTCFNGCCAGTRHPVDLPETTRHPRKWPIPAGLSGWVSGRLGVGSSEGGCASTCIPPSAEGRSDARP
jgi:hypothetical protein